MLLFKVSLEKVTVLVSVSDPFKRMLLFDVTFVLGIQDDMTGLDKAGVKARINQEIQAIVSASGGPGPKFLKVDKFNNVINDAAIELGLIIAKYDTDSMSK